MSAKIRNMIENWGKNKTVPLNDNSKRSSSIEEKYSSITDLSQPEVVKVNHAITIIVDACQKGQITPDQRDRMCQDEREKLWSSHRVRQKTDSVITKKVTKYI
jgi:hypothetical protein